MYKGAAMAPAPGDSPNAGWIPLSKGPHREPHEPLIPPRKVTNGNGLSNLHLKAPLKTPFQVPVRFHLDTI